MQISFWAVTVPTSVTYDSTYESLATSAASDSGCIAGGGGGAGVED
ncbi:hypothetical protein [Alkalitalea saponilacus]|nr:hypothetical protein [Alkalitalea saponilacus]